MKMRDLINLMESASPFAGEAILHIVGWKDGYQDLERLDIEPDEEEYDFYERARARLDDWIGTNRYDGVTIMGAEHHRGVFGAKPLNETEDGITSAEAAVIAAEETYDDAKHAYRDPGPMDDEDELNDAANAAFDRLEDAKERLAKLKEQ